MDKSGLVVSGREIDLVLRTRSISHPETTRRDLSIIALGTARLYIQMAAPFMKSRVDFRLKIEYFYVFNLVFLTWFLTWIGSIYFAFFWRKTVQKIKKNRRI